MSILTLSNADKLRFIEVEDRITKSFSDNDTMDFLTYLERLKEDRLDLKEENNVFASENADYRFEVRDLEGEVEYLENEISRLKCELDRAENTITHLEVELESWVESQT